MNSCTFFTLLFVILGNRYALAMEEAVSDSPPFQEACDLLERNELDQIMVLVSRHPEILGVGDEHQKTLLHRAISSGKLGAAQLLITLGHEIHPEVLYLRDAEGYTPFHSAAAKGVYEVLVHLLSVGYSVDCLDASHSTPLHRAARADHLEVVKLLLAAGAHPRSTNHLGATPLHEAASAGSGRICQMLMQFPCLVGALRNPDISIKRIITALCCIQKCGGLSRELIFKIFTDDDELIEDFAVTLLLMSYNPRKRAPNLSFSNTSAWRLAIRVAQDNVVDEYVLEPQDQDVLAIDPAGVTELTVSVYGNTWKVTQWRPLDLYNEMHAHVQEGCDMSIHIDGGQGTVTQFTRPFDVSYRSHKVEEFAPVSLVPRSRRLLDAFPCVKHKMVPESNSEEARCYFKLPLEYDEKMAERAYQRLVSVWQQEKVNYPENADYADQVLLVLKTAYGCLRQEEPVFLGAGLNKQILQAAEEKMSTRSLLRYAFFNKKKIPFAVVVQFFIELCLEQQARYLCVKDKEGRAPYECALTNEKLSSFLHPSNYEESFGKTLREHLDRCLRLAHQQEVEHIASQPLSSLIQQNALWQQLPEGGRLLLKTAGYVTAAPFFGAGLCIDRAARSHTTTEALTTLALIPVAMVGAIPVSLYLLLLEEAMKDM